MRHSWLKFVLFVVQIGLLTVLCGCKSSGPRELGVRQNAQGWKADATLAGRGGPGGVLAQWRFGAKPDGTPDQSSPRIALIPLPENQTYNLFWMAEPRLADLLVSVRVQARSGEIDQGGGPMWRVQDRDTYYVCRVNPLEGNFRVYRVVGGVRTQLGSVRVDARAAKPGEPASWHTITVDHSGDRIICTLDGGPRLEVVDSTISGAGGVGVWTKADAVTWFAEFSAISATSGSEPGRP
jgi:hypothetical protein